MSERETRDEQIEAAVECIVANWCGYDGSGLMLFPADWYESIPDGFQIVDINRRAGRFETGQTDDDRRWAVRLLGLRRCESGQGAAMTDDELKHDREMIERATPGDTTFIVAARTRWPVALDEVERLRAELDATQDWPTAVERAGLADKALVEARAEIERLREGVRRIVEAARKARSADPSTCYMAAAVEDEARALLGEEP
jgi:hypothetical protein